jgi:hypothetical protein
MNLRSPPAENARPAPVIDQHPGAARLDRVERVRELPAHLEVERVELLRPVEQQGGDAIRLRQDHQIVHDMDSRVWMDNARPGPGDSRRPGPATPRLRYTPETEAVAIFPHRSRALEC